MADIILKGKKRVADVMPIATGYEREELGAELELIPFEIHFSGFAASSLPVSLSLSLQRTTIKVCGVSTSSTTLEFILIQIMDNIHSFGYDL
ncbi:hypothetical protein LOK49_LG05G02888 [Camellia lanceoleosa]|uniref:Uncharacterized protein n=1 Tax=Camellia lanceoleosa TaxID=1840588 RepID=A0ACC0HP85_9ERIC|nr:hypothetical protein LOK49_LG05G02888 [Camellia lanceoleosa]